MNVSHPALATKTARGLVKVAECAGAIDTCRNVINAREDRLSEGSTWPERLESQRAVVVMARASLDAMRATRRDAMRCGSTFQACRRPARN
jgi:hypothetical protein